MALKHKYILILYRWDKKIFKKKKSHQRVGVRGDCKEAFLVKGSVAFSSADLGGSSNYSKEFFFKYYTLKTEVAKVFLTTVIDQELVDPKLKDYEK